MKKILMCVILGMFLISFASAFDFDNIKHYDAIEKIITINNCDIWIGICLNEGEKLAEIKLNSPIRNKINGDGYLQVANFTINSLSNTYENALKEMEFYDYKNLNNQIDKQFDYKRLTIIEEEINIYEKVCSELGNKTIVCTDEIVRTETIQKEEWIKLESTDILKGNHTIGIFTQVNILDDVEWIPTFYGVRINEWASYIQSSGTKTFIDIGGSNYTVLTFTSNGYFNTTKASLNISYLVVSGGGGGGSYAGTGKGGGGGAGGLLYDKEYFISSGNYVVEVGIGGHSPTTTYGGNGTNSSIGNVVEAFGGGGGGYYTPGVGLPGGSGGGGANSLAGGLGVVGQGHNGGSTNSDGSGGGGGGAGVVGSNGVGSDGGNGGIGLAYNITGINTTYSGGGGGGAAGSVIPLGGAGGGGNGSSWGAGDTPATPGINGTGGGGGAGQGPNENGKYGGNGIVIIRYLVSDGEILSPEVNLTTPINNSNQTNTETYFNYSITPRNTNLTNSTFHLWHSNGTLLFTNFTTLSGDQVVNLTQFYNFSAEGNYLWNAEGCAIDVPCTLADDNYTIIIHLTSPIVNMISPTGNYDYLLLGNNLSLNWSVVEPGTNLSEHIINCSYTYNDSITYLSINDCVNVNVTNLTYILDKNSLTFNVTDVYQLKSYNSTSWGIKFIEFNNTYSNETTEGNLETFKAYGKVLSGLSISSVNLIYNGTSYSGSSSTSGDTTTLLRENLLVPNVDADINISFYWTITLSDSTEINLSSQNQTIYNLSLDNCASNTNEILNFTLLDEETQVQLGNVTIETASNIYSGDRSTLIVNFSNLSSSNPTRICLNRNLTIDSNYSLDVVVRYETIDPSSAIEYYNIVDLKLTNSTSRQDIILYDLNLTDSTEFQLTFTGSDFLPVENALIYVDRQYISENVFKVVELPKTDFNGQTVLHLVRNDVVYNIRIIKDHVVLGNFENLVAFCDDFTIGDCNIELNAFDSVENVFTYNSELGLIFNSPTYNETSNKIIFNFVTSDGSSKNVIMNITRNDIFGNRTICETSLNSSGGTLTCDIDPNIDESTLNVEIYTDGVLTASGNVNLDTTNYGVAGYLIMFVMALSFVFMFSGSKTGVLISIGLTFASSIGMGLVSGSLIGIGASGIWLLVIIFIGIWKLNSERAS